MGILIHILFLLEFLCCKEIWKFIYINFVRTFCWLLSFDRSAIDPEPFSDEGKGKIIIKIPVSISEGKKNHITIFITNKKFCEWKIINEIKERIMRIENNKYNPVKTTNQFTNVCHDLQTNLIEFILHVFIPRYWKVIWKYN